MSDVYDPVKIEPMWSTVWMEEHVYRAENDSTKKKSYLLIEFPYPSGERLHVGHARSYSCMDSVARKRRMQGQNVLFPIGWDAFGLPAENYAIKTGIQPAITTTRNIANAKKQAISWGLSFDWEREINTTDPEYYKWTQWIFVQLFKHGLAYKQEIPVNWCPSCKINLANEEVIDGKCERCGTVTERRRQSQWLLRITEYADRLLTDLEKVDYRDDIEAQQQNWIGKKAGINITYKVVDSDDEITVFTTTPVNFGASFLVIAPEHPFAQEMAKTNKEVQKYVEDANNKSERDRISEGKIKTGVFTGKYVMNHVTGEKIPVWVADFVLSTIGTGAVQGCPGHDQRDWDFAKKFGLPIPRVVSNPGGDDKDITEEPYVVHIGDKGVMVNSGFLNGMDFSEAMYKTMDYFEEKGWGKKVETYHLRDWVFSRQHYWGEPIPMIFCQKCADEKKSFFDTSEASENTPFKFPPNLGGNDMRGIKMFGWFPVSEAELPVRLPEVEKYQPTETGESPLAHIETFVNTKCPNCGGPARRETDTMPNWAGSSWYYLRYCDPHNSSELAGKANLEYWLPVDWYNGGMEHTTLHLLYSRFWHKFLFDIGIVPTSEPYAKRTSHGVVLGPDGRKMSKSKGNVINPDEIVGKFGADTLRMYEMFIGPFDQMVVWSEESLEGVHRFIKRVWKLVISCELSVVSSAEAKFKMAQLIKTVDEDLEATKFNTAVASMMEFLNWWQDNQTAMGNDLVEAYVKLMAPMAPFVAEELWQRLQQRSDNLRPAGVKTAFNSVHKQSWPVVDGGDESSEKVTVVVQVNGKVREKLEVSKAQANDEKVICQLALASDKVKNYVNGPKYRQIFVPGKLVNFVV